MPKACILTDDIAEGQGSWATTPAEAGGEIQILNLLPLYLQYEKERNHNSIVMLKGIYEGGGIN